MECNCNNNNSNGGVIPWVRGNRLPLIICVYENVVTQEQVGDSTLTVNEMTRVPYTIQDNDTVTVIMKSGFRQVAMPFTTDGNKVMVTDNGELPTGAYTVEVTIERGDGARGRWQETRQVRIYENTSDAQLGEMYSIDADLFFFAKGDTGVGIANITPNPDDTLTITMTDGTTYTTNAVRGEQGEQGEPGERGVSIVSFDVTGQTDVSVIYTVTFSDDTTQDISVPKGPQGDTGLTGNGISSTTLNSDYTLTIAYTDGTTYTTPSIRGAQGAQGVSVIGFTQTGETATNTMYNLVFSDGRTQSVAIPKGVKGDKGDTGNTGPQGAQGPKGDTVTATDYTLYNAQGGSSEGAMSQDATTKAISAQTGYYTCGTVSGTAEKVVTVENGNLYKRTLGGHFKVKMTNANTASGVTLKIGSETAAALLYNGVAVSASNTWEEGEVISVYFDGSNYQASNTMGGGSSVKKKTLTFSSGFYDTSNAPSQGAAPSSRTSNSNFKSVKVPVSEGDFLVINGKASQYRNSRFWATIDSSNNYVKCSEVNAGGIDYNMVIPEGITAIVINCDIRVYANPSGYYIKKGSVEYKEVTDRYLYGDLRTLTVGQIYEVNEVVKTSYKQFRKVLKEIKALSLSETLAIGDIRTSDNATYRVASSVGIFNPSTTYTAGAYALGSMTVYSLTVTAESVTAGNITVNGTEVAIESTDDAAAIASKIADALVINGWTDSANDNVVTVRCNTIGNNTTTITIGVGDTGVIVDGISTPSEAGTSVIRKYNGETWTNASSSGMATDGVLVEIDTAWLIINATIENSITQEIADIKGFTAINLSDYSDRNYRIWWNTLKFGTNAAPDKHIFVPVIPGKQYHIETMGNSVPTDYAWVTGTTEGSNATPDYCVGCSLEQVVSNTEKTITAPLDAKYIYFTSLKDLTNSRPSFFGKANNSDERLVNIEKEISLHGYGDYQVGETVQLPVNRKYGTFWDYSGNLITERKIDPNNNFTSLDVIDVTAYDKIWIKFYLESQHHASTAFTDDENNIIGGRKYQTNTSAGYVMLNVPEGATRLYVSSRHASISEVGVKVVLNKKVLSNKVEDCSNAVEVLKNMSNIFVDYRFDAATGSYFTVVRIHKLKIDGTYQYAHLFAPYGNGKGRWSTLTMNRQFGFAVAINAGIFDVQNGSPTIGCPKGTLVVNGEIIQQQEGIDDARKYRFLTINSNGDLGWQEQTVTAAEMVAQGIVDAVAGWEPIVDNYVAIETRCGIGSTAQRQIIGQFGNGDYAIVTSEGRNNMVSDGWTMEEAQAVCVGLGLKFAYNLDGGGSTETVIGKKQINTIYEESTGRAVPTYIVFNGKTTI